LAVDETDDLQKFGDYGQILNPFIAAAISTQEKGLGHFAFIFAQDMALTHGVKLALASGKAGIGKRPSKSWKKDKYDGMPSGHTASAWVAAAYIRQFEQNKFASIPFYLIAGVTGYSRIKAKKHTTFQVIAGAALSELIVHLNKQANWSQEHKSYQLNLDQHGVSSNWVIRF
jgi:hypothetical protein